MNLHEEECVRRSSICRILFSRAAFSAAISRQKNKDTLRKRDLKSGGKGLVSARQRFR